MQIKVIYRDCMQSVAKIMLIHEAHTKQYFFLLNPLLFNIWLTITKSKFLKVSETLLRYFFTWHTSCVALHVVSCCCKCFITYDKTYILINTFILPSGCFSGFSGTNGGFSNTVAGFALNVGHVWSKFELN